MKTTELSRVTCTAAPDTWDLVVITTTHSNSFMSPRLKSLKTSTSKIT
jgi:hypothetical protein